MNRAATLLILLAAAASPLAAQPRGNYYTVFDGSTEATIRWAAADEGLYMVYRPELIRGLKTVDGFYFVAQDQNTATPEQVTIEIRKDDGLGMPGVLATDILLRSVLNLPFPTTNPIAASGWTVTLNTPFPLPNQDDAVWMGLRFPAQSAWPTTDGISLHASGGGSTQQCIEAPRGETLFSGELFAGINFTTTPVVAARWGSNGGNIGPRFAASFQEPVLQGFAYNDGYNKTAGFENFCTLGSNTPAALPIKNFGYAGIWPDVNDFSKKNRWDGFGWQVTANQLTANLGVAVLFFSDMTADPNWFKFPFGTLYLSFISKWFNLVQVAAPLTLDNTVTPARAIATFGPFSLGPANSVNRFLFARDVGPLHTQAVIVDALNINNIMFSNITTMNFDWAGKQVQVLDPATTFVKVPAPTNARRMIVHSVRGKLLCQAEVGGNPFGPAVTVQDGGTKTIFGVPAGGQIDIRLDPAFTGNTGAKFEYIFTF